MKKGLLTCFAIALILIACFSVEASQIYQPNPLSYYSADISNYWPTYGKEECTARQDFIVEILPGGCSPAVVRSDLLEEQDVPVFCQLTGIKINPLINVPEITSITFKGAQLPKDIGGIGFHPAQAALRTTYNTLLGSPVINDLGYLVIRLKRQPIEKNMSDWVEGNLTAVIQYQADKTFGVGKTSFVSSVLDDNEWQQNYKQYGFWKGKGYVRVSEIGRDSQGEYARVDIYLNENQRVTSIMLREGQTSNDIYIPGYYCQAALKLTLATVSSEPKAKAKLNINGEELWVEQGQNIIEGKCTVSGIDQDIYGSGDVEIRCQTDTYKVSLNPASAKLSFEIGNIKYNNVYSTKDEQSRILADGVMVAFIGDTGKAKSQSVRQLDSQFVVLAKPRPEVKSLVLNDAYYQSITFKVRKLIEGDKFNGFSTLSGQSFKALISSLFIGEKISDDQKKETDSDKEIREGDFKKQLEERLRAQFGNKIDFKVFLVGESARTETIGGTVVKDFRFDGLESSYDKEYKSDIGKVMEQYYQDTIEEYRKISTNYGGEKSQIENEDPYGAQALYQAADLAGYLKKFNTKGKILTEIIEKYPETKSAEKAKEDIKDLKSNDLSNAVATAFVDGDAYNIMLEEVQDASMSDKSVKLKVYSKEEEINTEGDYTVGDIVAGNIIIKEIYEDRIELEGTGLSLSKPSIKKGETAVIAYQKADDKTKSGSITLTVSGINLNKHVQILITPRVERAETQTNFTFKIGIEKRAIKLSPEKTRDLVNQLNSTIAQWEKITNDLGNLVKAWKGTCYAGSAFLWIKNFFSSMGGGSIARQKVMRGSGGWWEKCAQEVADGKYDKDVHKCLAANNDKIESDIAVFQKYIDPVNKRIEDTTVKSSNGMIDTKKSREERIASMEKDYENIGDTLLKNEGDTLGKGPTALNKEQFTEIINNLDKSSAFDKDLTDMDTWLRVASDPQASDMLKTRANSELQQIMYPLKSQITVKSAQNSLSKTLTDLKFEDTDATVFGSDEKLITQKIAMYDITKSDLTDKIINAEKIDFGTEKEGEKNSITTKIMMIPPISGGKDSDLIKYAGLSVLAVFTQTGVNQYTVKEMYALEETTTTDKDGKTKNILKIIDDDSQKGKDLGLQGGKLSQKTVSLLQAESKVRGFDRIVPKSCKNEYKNPEVKYHETAPYKGLPALIPLTKDGWYVATKPLGQGIQAFQASGKVSSFWLCNVGPNGLAEFFTGSENDDICEQFNLDQVTELPSFANCLTKSELTNLVLRAQQAFSNVGSTYKSSITSVNLPEFGNVKVTPAPVINPEIECEDFMSPADCNLMFNLCDPVLCPSSRCDFGGRYAVPDVVQTGIIGGIMLCLPNFGSPSEGGVVVPVCLSGIQAGLDGLVNVLKATRDCLQEELTSGRTVGICDQIQSVYLCEFFWKEAIPLMKIGIPQLMQSVFGGKSKGGGEYLVMQESWNNLDKSLEYFTNQYGVNAFKAFQARSTEDVGSEVCKAFVSVAYPTSKDFFDKLTEPDSPTQFYAKFSENVLTDATVPATSQYKVYFFIYAGKDKGVYYSVYLKGETGVSYYQGLGNINVPGAVGFIPQGERVDKSVDFTAPANYKELCVRIDNDEKCGFTELTTSFGLDELKNLYLEDQAKQEVTTEEECVSGTSSLMPLASLNIQQGAEEAINPAIYKRGIIRICATQNPGGSTEPNRWTAVGYCSDRQIKCWLDGVSVNNSISDTGIASRTLEQAKDLLNTVDAEGLMDKQQSEEKIASIDDDAKKIKDDIEVIIKNGNEGNAKEMQIKIDTKIEPLIKQYREIIEKSLFNDGKLKANAEIAALYDWVTRQIYKKFFEEQAGTIGEQNKVKSKTLIDLSKVTVGEKISVGESGLGEEVIVTDISDLYKGEFTAKGTSTNTLYTYKYDSTTNTAEWAAAGAATAEQISKEITASAVLMFNPAPSDNVILEDLLNAIGITDSDEIDDTVKVINANKGTSLTRASGIIGQIQIPLSSTQQSNFDKNAPMSCADYEKGMSGWGKFWDNDADQCKAIKFKFTATTSTDKSKKYYYIYTTSCSFNFETQKCEESKAPAGMEDAEFQARQSFDKLVEGSKNCLNYQQSNCKCGIDVTEVGRINLKSDFKTVFTIQVEYNKLSLLKGTHQFGYVGGFTLKKPAIKTEAITGIAPCYINKKTSAALSPDIVKGIVEIKSFVLVASQSDTEPRADLTPAGGSYVYPIKDLIKLSDNSLCFVTTESNVADNLPMCGGEKKV